VKGVVVWITGLPASGKSTLAARVHEALAGSVLLDGDALRALFDLGYQPADRGRFYDILARLAALVAAQGLVVLVPATAHERRYRERARRLAPRFLEVFVRTPLAECRKRDPKGLYARDVPGLPGLGVAYEEPTEPDVVAVGGRDEAAARRILALVRL
jgi:adenylylsulfate kinase